MIFGRHSPVAERLTNFQAKRGGVLDGEMETSRPLQTIITVQTIISGALIGCGVGTIIPETHR